MQINLLGLIVNPAAGKGKIHNLQAAAAAVAALMPARVLAAPGALGAEAVEGWHPALEIVPPQAQGGRAVTQELSVRMAQSGVDALAVVGGDGTLADAATALYRAGLDCPILGIGAGSINAGALVTCTALACAGLRPANLSAQSVAALCAAESGQVLALAFNDVVIGTTIVGTVGGQVTDLDARAFMEGRQAAGQPAPVGRTGARVVKISPLGTREIARGAEIGTLIAGFSDCAGFYGKAIAGPVLLAALCGAPAGCLVCEQPIVRTQLSTAALQQAEPVRCAFAGLSPGETIEVSGLAAPAILCADGNPLLAFEPQRVAQIRLAADAVRVVRTI